MRLGEIRDLLQARVLVDGADSELVVESGCGSDLLSDVLAFTHSGVLLLTGLSHPQVVRTAEVASIPAIVFVRGKAPSEDTVALAQERGIALLQTDLTLFEACGRLYAAGLRSCDVRAEPRSSVDERNGAALGSAPADVLQREAKGTEHGR